MIWPWHSGQSGQPMPDPVARTMTPIVTSRIVVTTVAAASFWKRVTRLLGGRGVANEARRRDGPPGAPIGARLVGHSSVRRARTRSRKARVSDWP